MKLFINKLQPPMRMGALNSRHQSFFSNSARLSSTNRVIRFKNYLIHHNNEASAQQTLEEVFEKQPYYFQASHDRPWIIDAGSNIGISVLFFKMCYPLARILCFEPDPHAFLLLKKNVAVNRLEEVHMINAALADRVDNVAFYGQIHAQHPDARGNSLLKTWGAQRATFQKINVPTVPLSQYLSREIDFLKLDIEGAETQVLQEVGARLRKVKALSVEVHEACGMESVNSLSAVQAILNRSGFQYEVTANDISVLPPEVQAWASQVQPRLYTLRAEQGLAPHLTPSIQP